LFSVIPQGKTGHYYSSEGKSLMLFYYYNTSP